MSDDLIPAAPTPSWFIEEGRPGDGERPSWLNDKFKTAADLARSYHELEKKVGTPPDAYDISNSKYIDPDYVPFQDLLTLARDKRVPKDVVDKMVDSFDKYMDEFAVDWDEEAKKLGDDAPQRLKTLDNWAKANLSEDSYNALTNNLKSADAIKALEELRGKMMSNTTMIPPANGADSLNAPTLDDVKKELADNLEKYKTDSKYRTDLQKRLEIASKNNTNYIDKMGA